MTAGSVPHPGAASSEDRPVQVYADDAHPAHEPGLDWVRRFVHADCCARHLRARGEEVRFGLVVDGGEATEVAARLEVLGVSCDRAVATADDAARQVFQELFLALLARDLLYTRDPQPWEGGGRWFLRSADHVEWAAAGLDRLGGTAAAVAVQRELLGRVEGVELTATLLGAGDLTVFTPSAEAIGEAEFVAVSPRHPEIGSIIPAARLEALARSTAQVPAVQADLQAAVPGVEGLLPVVVTPAHEPLALASLGIPRRDEDDRLIAAELTKAGGLPLKTRDSGKPRPAVRYSLADLPVSRPDPSGVAVPVLLCRSCGVVAVPFDQLPLRSTGEGPDLTCSGCGGPAERDPEALSSSFEGMWSWALLVAREGESPLAAAERFGSLPRMVISTSGDGGRLLHQRIATKLLQQLGGVAEGDAEDLVEGAAAVGQLKSEEAGCVSGLEELDELVRSEGADAVRFALLDAAAVGTSTGLYPHTLRRAKRFLDELRDFAEPRLGAREVPPPPEIDRGARLRRRLASWCGAASDHVGEAFHGLETGRVTHNLALLLRRIQDFEERATVDGELSVEDRDAVAHALSVLVDLAAPCVPETAAELRALAGAEPVAIGQGSSAQGGE